MTYCLFLVGFLTSCTTLTIDEYRPYDQPALLTHSDAIVILGRRHSSDYETEPELIRCVGRKMSGKHGGIEIVPEKAFLDAVYPWFEPRTAPMRAKDLNFFLENEVVGKAINNFKIRYFVWVDGNTETTNSAGSIGCSISAGGAGCFGFGTWDKESDYEATVWDYHQGKQMGQISVDATGTSYMPAIVLPIPLIARVKGHTCDGLSQQLATFFVKDAKPKEVN